MQDKNNTNLANRGWQSMELILDEEMPQKKKRRFIVWWFFGGALMVLAILVYFLQNPLSSNMSSIASTPEDKYGKDISKKVVTENSQNDVKDFKPINEKVTPIVENTNNQNEAIRANELVLIPNRNEKLETKPAPIKNAKSTTERSSISSGESQDVVQFISNAIASEQSSILNTIPENSNLSTTKNRKEIISELSNTKASEEKAKEIENEALEEIATSKIETGELDIPNIERTTLAFQYLPNISELELLNFQRDITIVLKNYKRNYWYGNVGGGVLWNPDVNLTGLNANADIGYSFNDRFDIGFTLGTGAFKYPSDVQDKTAIDVTGRNVFSEAEAGNVLRSSLKNVSFVELGLHTRLGLSNRIKVRGDAGFKYLYTSMFNNSSSALFDANDVQGAPEDIDVSTAGGAGGALGTTQDFEFRLSQQWFPYASVGLEYQVSRKVALGVSYIKVFGDLFEASSSPLTMNRLQLGIKYSLFRRLQN